MNSNRVLENLCLGVFVFAGWCIYKGVVWVWQWLAGLF